MHSPYGTEGRVFLQPRSWLFAVTAVDQQKVVEAVASDVLDLPRWWTRLIRAFSK
jgi:hypothetical protein